MLRQLIGILVRNEVAGIKRRSKGGILLLAGVMLGGLASLFGLLAFYLWLATKMQDWQAALIIAGLILLLAVILVLVGRQMIRRQVREQAELEQLLDRLSEEAKAQSGKVGLPGLMIGAALAGLLIGRRLGD